MNQCVNAVLGAGSMSISPQCCVRRKEKNFAYALFYNLLIHFTKKVKELSEY